MQDCEVISGIMMENGSDEILFAESAEQKSSLWKIRRRVAEAVRKKILDVRFKILDFRVVKRLIRECWLALNVGL